MLCLAILAMLCCGLARSAPAAVTVTRIAGPPVTAASAELTDDSLSLIPANEGKPPTQIPREQVIALALSDSTSTATPPDGVLLEFANGDRFFAKFLGFDKGRLQIRAFGDSLSVPLGQLRGIVFHIAADRDRAWPLLFRQEGAQDLVLLANGDQLTGQFLAGDRQHITLLIDGRQTQIPRRQLAVIAFSPELISMPRTATKRQIVFGPAGWLTVIGLRGTTSGSLHAETSYGEVVAFQPRNVRRILFLGPRVVPLTDLKPVKVEYTPWLRQVPPVHWNRSLADRPLTLGDPLSLGERGGWELGIGNSGSESQIRNPNSQLPESDQKYALGMGLHSATTITYSLKGDYDRFTSLLGLAPSAGARGRVSIVVAADGEPLFQRRALSRGDGTVSLDVPLNGAKTLSLNVGFGPGGNILDRMNWCCPLLLKVDNP